MAVYGCILSNNPFIIINTATTYPILFNSLKHHFTTLQYNLHQLNPEALHFELLTIGGSQMDMYAGKLDITGIFREIMDQLYEAGIHTRGAYEQLLNIEGGYAEMVLSDSSRWVLRLAANKPQYIHLHPARYSPHTFRVKAATLKTALSYHVAQQHKLLKGNLLEDINQLRSGLELSPIRTVAESKQLLEIMTLIGCRLSEKI
ncbi:hypothetical protein CLV51_102981 [Chitinophaga niastensis]|uniref:Uncharacterized protein n=1 Tax=Chitinophaga niastensis TaxID=536980 RepID=A0A2P8HPH2_CHINA|nr:hypothetical protein [Chitinophaga niastensis]PSL48119.1 hypothetical protein CLV51_102981 [Chitinophaga niastensis]